MYYNRSGEPITLDEWVDLMSSQLYRTVAQSHLGPYFVSTIWLGLDHSFNADSTPIIFETMVFGAPGLGKGLEHDKACYRWSTEEEARRGHHEIITLIRATTDASD